MCHPADWPWQRVSFQVLHFSMLQFQRALIQPRPHQYSRLGYVTSFDARPGIWPEHGEFDILEDVTAYDDSDFLLDPVRDI